MEAEITAAKLLVVSRDATILRTVWSVSEPNLWQCEMATSAWDAMEQLQSGMAVDLLLVDLSHGETDGFEILSWLRRLRPVLPIILIDHVDDAARKRRAIRMGACDYLLLPLTESQVSKSIHCSLSSAGDVSEIDNADGGVEPLGDGRFFIGLSPIMRKLRAQVALLAEADFPVLISGEQGSGKETIARLLHRLSARSEFEFARVDCGALSEESLEKELFGHETFKGGASSPISGSGKLELGAKGTLFLVDIDEMPVRLQSSLVRVVQSGSFVRPGTFDKIKVDVRIVAARSISSDRELSERMLLPEFSRQPGVFEIKVPPLRERKEDLSLLSRHFMHQLARQFGLASRDFTPATEEAWRAHEWPGNLPELKQAIKHYLIFGEPGQGENESPSDGKAITKQVAFTAMSNVSETGLSHVQSMSGIIGCKSLRSLLRSIREDTEKHAIALALENTGWNRKAAARLLKVSYRTILYKIEQYDMRSLHRSALPAPDPSESREDRSHTLREYH
jgi:DNA-binding NtrC family response regulator